MAWRSPWPGGLTRPGGRRRAGDRREVSEAFTASLWGQASDLGPLLIDLSRMVWKEEDIERSSG